MFHVNLHPYGADSYCRFRTNLRFFSADFCLIERDTTNLFNGGRIDPGALQITLGYACGCTESFVGILKIKIRAARPYWVHKLTFLQILKYCEYMVCK